MQVSLDQQLCLKEINNIGSTTYQNVCNGQLTTVPWGVGDWLVGVISFFMIVVLMMLGFGLAFAIIRDLRGY